MKLLKRVTGLEPMEAFSLHSYVFRKSHRPGFVIHIKITCQGRGLKLVDILERESSTKSETIDLDKILESLE